MITVTHPEETPSPQTRLTSRSHDTAYTACMHRLFHILAAQVDLKKEERKVAPIKKLLTFFRLSPECQITWSAAGP
jgi:hypothetical protein